ncbi:NLR family CARD domain-containing protein 3 [Sarotherodon galilaeus]
MASTVDPRFKDLPFLSEAETSETFSRLLDTVVAVINKEKNQQENKETDKQVEEENATEEAHHPLIKDSFDSIPRPPLKRQRTSCALVDLLGATFASTSDNTAPKSEHDVAAAEIKRQGRLQYGGPTGNGSGSSSPATLQTSPTTKPSDRKRLNRLIRWASSILGCPLDPVEVVSGRRMVAKLSSLLDNISHPMQETLTALSYLQ